MGWHAVRQCNRSGRCGQCRIRSGPLRRLDGDMSDRFSKIIISYISLYNLWHLAWHGIGHISRTYWVADWHLTMSKLHSYILCCVCPCRCTLTSCAWCQCQCRSLCLVPFHRALMSIFFILCSDADAFCNSPWTILMPIPRPFPCLMPIPMPTFDTPS